MSVGTHVTHCCILHGCKYGDDENCPVENGSNVQQYPCEYCKEPEDLLAQAVYAIDEHVRQVRLLETIRTAHPYT